jgi:DNA-binding PadR family transcriptional regulator
MNIMSLVSRQDPPSVTGFALLGLLSLRGRMSGYALKKLADRTLRFFWVAPAMSHIYSELGRLARQGMVIEEVVEQGGRRLRRYSLSAPGAAALEEWLGQGEVEFPVLKHEVALRLFLGHITGPKRPRVVLDRYGEQLQARTRDLQAIRDSLGADPRLQYAALVAEWGIRYYQEELEAVAHIGRQLSKGATLEEGSRARAEVASPSPSSSSS